jgi:hypothetical protein
LIQADSATATYFDRIARGIVPEMAIFASLGSPGPPLFDYGRHLLVGGAR